MGRGIDGSWMEEEHPKTVPACNLLPWSFVSSVPANRYLYIFSYNHRIGEFFI